jgi:hypothetical protein
MVRHRQQRGRVTPEVLGRASSCCCGPGAEKQERPPALGKGSICFVVGLRPGGQTPGRGPPPRPAGGALRPSKRLKALWPGVGPEPPPPAKWAPSRVKSRCFAGAVATPGLRPACRIKQTGGLPLPPVPPAPALRCLAKESRGRNACPRTPAPGGLCRLPGSALDAPPKAKARPPARLIVSRAVGKKASLPYAPVVRCGRSKSKNSVPRFSPYAPAPRSRNPRRGSLRASCGA